MTGLYFFNSAILLTLTFVLLHQSKQGRFMMSTQDAVDALTAQVDKIHQEVTAARDVLSAHLADVQAQLDAAGVPAEQVDLSALQSAVQALDDINPDPVVDPPADPA